MYGDYGTFLRLNKKSSDYLEKNILNFANNWCYSDSQTKAENYVHEKLIFLCKFYKTLF